MPRYYSFLSPGNINYLIMRLRNIYPENVHQDIRESTPYLAHNWYYTEAVNVEQQFTEGTEALNRAYINYIIALKKYIPAEPDNLPSYSTDIMDPYVPNQPFQNVTNDVIYDSQINDFNVRNIPSFADINQQLNEADLGGIPISSNMTQAKLAQMATEISRNRVRKVKPQQLTWGVKRQCADNARTCEHPALPRKKFTLPQDYYSSAPQSGYWLGLQPCNSEMKKYTEWSATGRTGRLPTTADDGCNPRISEMLINNAYKYPNYAYYRKDIIPAVRQPYQNNSSNNGAYLNRLPMTQGGFHQFNPSTWSI
jgi:hypothetical protein